MDWLEGEVYAGWGGPSGIRGARLSAEDLGAMPGDELARRVMFRSDRRVQPTAVMPQQRVFELLGAVRFFGDQHAPFIAERESADIEELVMQATQRDTVFDHIWAFELKPFDVRGFEADRAVADAHVEVAQRAAVLIRPEHVVAKVGTATRFGCQRRVEREADGGENVVVHAVGEMRVEQCTGDVADCLRIAVEGTLNVIGEAAGRLDAAQLRLCQYRVGRKRTRRAVRGDPPDVVAL